MMIIFAFADIQKALEEKFQTKIQSIDAFPKSEESVFLTMVADNTALLQVKENSKLKNVRVKFYAFDDQIVSKRDLKKNESFSKEDFEVQKIDKAILKNFRLESASQHFLDSLENFELAKNIPFGSIVNESFFKPKLMVKKNQMIPILLKSGEVSLRTKGIALSDGRIGDIVSIKTNEKENRILSVKINNSGIYEVLL